MPLAGRVTVIGTRPAEDTSQPLGWTLGVSECAEGGCGGAGVKGL